jgi:glycosyltransferase involved in cell wall biosynthesis
MDMKVLQTVGRDIMEGCGSPIRVMEISRNLSRRKGFKISVGSFGKVKSLSVTREGSIEIRRIPYYYFKTTELRHLINVSRLFSMNKRIIKENGTDIVHSHLFGTTIASLLIKKKLGLPYIYDIHSLFPEDLLSTLGFFGKIRNFHWKFIENVLRNNADYIVATSDTMMNYLKSLGYKKVESVPVGVDQNFFRPMKRRDDIARKYGIEGRDVVMYTGNMNPYQGVDDIIRSIPEVIRENKNVSFVIAGSGSDLDRYKRMTRDLNVEKNVVFTGNIDYDEMPSLLSIADLTLSMRTSTFCGKITFPTKLTTYMSSGKPSVCTRIGDQKSIITNWKSGFLVDSGDVTSLSETITDALSDRKRLNAMGRKGRQAAIKAFSWDVLCEKYVKIYGEILKST